VIACAHAGKLRAAGGADRSHVYATLAVIDTDRPAARVDIDLDAGGRRIGLQDRIDNCGLVRDHIDLFGPLQEPGLGNHNGMPGIATGREGCWVTTTVCQALPLAVKVAEV